MRRETIRIMVTMPIELDNALHEFGSKARETGGYKISKTAIIRALVRVFNDLDVDHTGVIDDHSSLLIGFKHFERPRSLGYPFRASFFIQVLDTISRISCLF